MDLKKARILVVMPSIPVQGMERANLQIMKMMREEHAEILFIADQMYGREVQKEIEQIGCRWIGIVLIKTYKEGLHLTINIGEMFFVVLAWMRTARQIDKIYRQYKPTHFYITNFSFFLYAFVTLRRTKKPVIFRLPNPPDLNLPDWKQTLSNWIWRRIVYPTCDFLVCNCQYTASQLNKVVGNSDKIKVIYNCVPERGLLEKSDVPVLDRTQFNIVYLGRIHPEKGVEELFEAASRIVSEQKDINVYLVGEHKWKNPFAENLLERIEKSNLGSQIRILDPIKDVAGLLEQCNLHICPSISPSESFPNVVLEAKAQGVPSVVFPTAGLPEAITHLKDGYICENVTSEALYKGMQYFLANRETLQRAGQAARESLKRFSRERIAEEWIQVFKDSDT